MSKRDQIATTKGNEAEPGINPAPAPTDPTADTSSTPSTQPVTEEKHGQEAAPASGGEKTGSRGPVKDPIESDETLQKLVDKLLTEGSTFEDVVEAANRLVPPGVTLNAVKTYFQGNRKLQADRVHYMVETSESLLKGLGDPESAEARLAKAAILTGFMNLHQDTPQISLKDAEHARIEQANLTLKHRLVVAQRDKARQALQYSKERTRLLVLAQEKVTEQIAILQQDAKRQQAGEPLGPAMLQRIQQIYGLTCQPMPYGGHGDAAKA
jgi:hypothetical protein